MTGEKLFHMYVSAGLCTSTIYIWDELSVPMQTRWNLLAKHLVMEIK